MEKIKTAKEIKILSYKRLFGLFIFSFGLLIGFYDISNTKNLLFGTTFILLGWFYFSINHAKISINKLHSITQNYLKETVLKSSDS